jgi:hypothetical protein
VAVHATRSRYVAETTATAAAAVAAAAEEEEEEEEAVPLSCHSGSRELRELLREA